MDRKLWALWAATALVAVPGLASANDATTDAPNDHGFSVASHCSPQPYLAELQCRVWEAYCALVCSHLVVVQAG